MQAAALLMPRPVFPSAAQDETTRAPMSIATAGKPRQVSFGEQCSINHEPVRDRFEAIPQRPSWPTNR